MKKIIKTLIVVLNIALSLLLAISYLATYITPEYLSFPAVVGLAFPFILLFNVIFIFFWLLVKPKYALISTITVLAGVNLTLNYININSSETVKRSKNELKFLSYNVANYNFDKEDKIFPYLKESSADIISLQEVSFDKKKEYTPKRLVKYLKKIRYEHHVHANKYSGLLILSRYPIINTGDIDFERSSNLTIFADIVLPKNDTIRLYNCHLQSYSIRPKEYKTLSTPLEVIGSSDTIKSEATYLYKKLIQAFKMRAQQTDSLKRHIAESPYRVVISGDLNDTPMSYCYNKLKDNRADPFRTMGNGISSTYNELLSTFRIDHLFYPKEWNCTDYKVKRLHLSDHEPIEVTLKLN